MLRQQHHDLVRIAPRKASKYPYWDITYTPKFEVVTCEKPGKVSASTRCVEGINMRVGNYGHVTWHLLDDRFREHPLDKSDFGLYCSPA